MMKWFRNKYTRKYGNFYKIYSMPIWKLRVLDFYLSYLIAVQNLQGAIAKIPHIIITPAGILANRRRTTQFVPIERRLVNIIRYKLYMFLYGFDDSEGAS